MSSRAKAKPPKTPKPSEFTRFEELTRKLISVPKAEVDKQKAKYESEEEKGSADR